MDGENRPVTTALNPVDVSNGTITLLFRTVVMVVLINSL